MQGGVRKLELKGGGFDWLTLKMIGKRKLLACSDAKTDQNGRNW